MLNIEEFNAPELRLAIPFVKEAIRLLLHTIILNRSIGGGQKVLEPVQCHSDLFDVSYFKVDDRELEQKIDTYAREFCNLFERPTNASPRMNGCLTISFHTIKLKSVTGAGIWDWITRAEEKIVFENWTLPLVIVPVKKCMSPSENLEQEGTLQRHAREQVRESMIWCIKKINSKLDHLPPPPQASIWYPFDINFDNTSWSPRNFGTMGSMKIPYLTK